MTVLFVCVHSFVCACVTEFHFSLLMLCLCAHCAHLFVCFCDGCKSSFRCLSVPAVPGTVFINFITVSVLGK